MTLPAFERWHPIGQALAAGAFMWAVTALGAALVICTKHVRRKTIDSMEGFAAGVMLAASYWSLLAPALELSTRGSCPRWLLPALGFVAGGVCLCLIDRAWAHRRSNLIRAGTITHKRTGLLVLAITLHNIPEGLAVGVAFGAAAQGFPEATLAAAMILAVGIGIQNFPEGLAVALPLRRDGVSVAKSFWYGQCSALVEPVAAVAGASAVLVAKPILPFALSFAAGAMIFVIIKELVPDFERGRHGDLATLSTLAGFTLMMVLDVAFG